VCMIRPGTSVNSTGDDNGTGENQDHDAAMIRDPVTVRAIIAEWVHHQSGEDRTANGIGLQGPISRI